MWEYSDKVKEYFFNPKNAGAVPDANAIGEVGSISCGDALRLTLKVDSEVEIILDAGFQTFGCGSAIASSSALTEMIKGMTLDEALKITTQDIANFLDGLPPEKMHCSVMGREALQAAIANYRGNEWHDDHEEGELLCKCFGVDRVVIEETILANSLCTVQDVINYTKAGGGCASCHEDIEEILAKMLDKGGETTLVDASLAVGIKPSLGITNLQRIRCIERVLESIRPTLQRDHGDVELVEVDGKTAYINMIGSCSGCQMASQTLSGIQQRLMEDLGEFIHVVPVQHA